MTRVAFAGGKPPGIACFRRLLRSEAQIVGVFPNAEDGQPAHWYDGPTLSELAEARGLALYPTLDAKTLVALDVDLLLVVYYDAILPPDVIAAPAWGCVNLHLGLAEEYRGAYPTIWPILDGKERAGVTLHIIDAGIDSGPIIAQGETAVTPDDTGRSLYTRLAAIGADLFAQWLPALLAGPVTARPQVATAETRTRYRKEFPGYEVPAPESVSALVRALTFPPFPPPHIVIGGQKYVIIPEETR